MKAFALHNPHRYIDEGRLHLFSDLLFWLPHQINSLNNSLCDCGGGRLVRVGCHTGVEPQAWVCSKDGNVCYVCLAVQYNFARSKEVTVHLKRLFLSYGSWNCLDGRLKNSEKINQEWDCLHIKISEICVVVDRSCDFTAEMLELSVFTCSEEAG